MNSGEQIWCVLLKMSFETFTPMWSHVNEKGKNGKSPKFDISQFSEWLW